MASFLDPGLINIFSPVFTFLLVYAVFWGILTKTEFLGKSQGVYAIIALAGALLVTISRPARAYVEFIAPWFFVLGLVFFFVVITVSMFTKVDWQKFINYGTTQTWIVIIIAIILLSGLGTLFGQQTLEATTGTQPGNIPVVNEEGEVFDARPVQGTGTGDFGTNVANTIVHPKVLGIILIFGLSALIVYFLSRPVA